VGDRERQRETERVGDRERDRDRERVGDRESGRQREREGDRRRYSGVKLGNVTSYLLSVTVY
jgi:hypothetical protein